MRVSGAAFKPLNLQQSADFAVSLILARRRGIRRASSSHPGTRAVTGSSSAPTELLPAGAAYIQTETNPFLDPVYHAGVFYTQAPRATVVTHGNM